MEDISAIDAITGIWKIQVMINIQIVPPRPPFSRLKEEEAISPIQVPIMMHISPKVEI